MRFAVLQRIVLITLACVVLCSAGARGAEVEMFSPQGEVKSVRQATARFSAPMVAFGDPRLVDPMTIDCPEGGAGRWADTRTWVYDFERDLPGGVRCSFSVKNDLRALDGEAVRSETFSFNTGGSAVIAHLPQSYERIDEEQIFVLALNTPASAQSIVAHAWCEAAGIEERIGVRLIEGEARERVLTARKDFFERLRYMTGAPVEKVRDIPLVLVQCERRLPPESEVRLVWGKGIESMSGLPTSADYALTFTVRADFSASFHCQRVRRDADCLPITPMELSFSAPIPRSVAQKIRLHVADRTFKSKLPDSSEGDWVTSVTFPGPFPERATMKLEIPSDLRDDAGRRLANAKRFPLTVVTDVAPPLAKFAARFGIIEANGDATVPVTLRNLEPTVAGAVLAPSASSVPGKPVAQRHVPGEVLHIGKADAYTIATWLKRVRAHEDVNYIEGGEGEPARDYAAAKSILDQVPGVRRITVPKPNGARAFEVVGIPLKQPGFYVIELASPKLGAALLAGSNPKAQGGEIYHVSTAMLVTNLAVHLKHGRESSLVWVTALDSAAPVRNAEVSVQDCTGKQYWKGVTNASGIARIERALPLREALPACLSEGDGQLMVFAKQGADVSFVLSEWDEGISRWRFNLPGGNYRGPYLAATVLDRSLVRAGDTVHMKHFYRQQTRSGFRLLKQSDLPKEVTIEHQGSDERYRMPVMWDPQNIAESGWQVPREAKTGQYRVVFEDRLGGRQVQRYAATFRVEEFRVPVMRAAIDVPRPPQVHVQQLEVDVQVSYLAGGGAANAPVRLRGVVEPRIVRFDDYDAFSFMTGAVEEGVQSDASVRSEFGGEELGARSHALKTQALNLDKAGGARAVLSDIPLSDRPQTLLAELEYSDPNGEILTASRRVALWPAQFVLGIKPDSWALSKDKVKLQVVALDLDGRPKPAVKVSVDAFQRRTFSHRKRLLGGFYAYESGAEVKRLDTVCEGETDARGLLFCEFVAPAAGELLMQARSRDEAGNSVATHTSLWVAGEDEWWFEASNDDRMDVIPERKRYEPGEKAIFQVRMPFRAATALVTVEREGVMESFVTKLSGKSPVIEVPMRGHYAPNVFVSVLAVRGRVAGVQPTALVDLGKPTFRMGIAQVEVGWRQHALEVKVSTDKSVYRVREKALATIEVRRASDGAPAANAEVALAAVDEGLLELAPNESWKLLDTMMQKRSLEVDTSTASMQVVGKRHYGRKSRETGGGGGRQSARELFDTLLLWKGRVKLDAQGRARVEIPLNDSLTSFRIVAVANAQAGRFGTGSTTIRSSQDLMVFGGLPPLVREQDRYTAAFTVRNARDKAVAVRVEASMTAESGGKRGAAQALAPVEVSLDPGASQEVGFDVKAPLDADALHWQVIARSASSDGERAEDRLRVTQKVVAAVPVRTFQAALAQLAPTLELPVQMPNDAVPGRGGVRVNLMASLAGDLPGVHEYMSRYPFSCLEQLVSQAVALRDKARWSKLMDTLPAYLDRDGFARYFPALEFGSDVLTTYLISIADAAGWTIPGAPRARMQSALERFVTGQLTREAGWRAPDLSIRKIAALQALARLGRQVSENDLASITIEPNLWPTSAIIDWLDLLARTPQLVQGAERAKAAEQILRARLDLQGTSLNFSSARSDLLWWLMVDADVNANRLLLTVLDRPSWQTDLARLVRGSLNRQLRGHWSTTVANAWGVLAMEKFSARHEAGPVSGITHGSLAKQEREVEWRDGKGNQVMQFAWPENGNASPLMLAHRGEGKPWANVQSLAAIPLKQPLFSGYRIERAVTPVEQRDKGRWSRGDVMHVRLTLEAQSDMTWVAVRDPIPAGGTILGSGLGRDARILDQRTSERDEHIWPVFEERKFDAFSAYYDFVPKGNWVVEYNVRLNNAGEFSLPPTRVEALYLPEMFGELPNGRVTIAR
ncbi:MAG TPA: MG2 domain-containing protein [Burkholderiales bacterium]|nr:MG2 domain-containing protein [Burkholderiales bacterium]